VLDVFEGGGPFVQDQLEHAALPDDPSITDAELGTYFHAIGSAENLEFQEFGGLSAPAIP
jgi:hypothetical protein